MTREEAKAVVLSNLSERALLEQLAEECAELSQAALKMIRARGNGNSTPVDADHAYEAMREEAGDVVLLLELLRVNPLTSSMDAKMTRWSNRILTMNL